MADLLGRRTGLGVRAIIRGISIKHWAGNGNLFLRLTSFLASLEVLSSNSYRGAIYRQPRYS